MTKVHCPNCKRLLFKAKLANIEIVCGSCKRLVKVNFVSQSGLLGSSLINYAQDEERNRGEN